MLLVRIGNIQQHQLRMQAHDAKRQDRELLALAENIAREWHASQFRRDGVTPYITHPEAVAAKMGSVDEKIVAWLHDVFEDTDAPLRLLWNFPRPIRSAVRALTKRPHESYTDYLSQVREYPLARAVKLADIEHNLSCEPTKAQIQKYKKAIAYLKG